MQVKSARAAANFDARLNCMQAVHVAAKSSSLRWRGDPVELLSDVAQTLLY